MNLAAFRDACEAVDGAYFDRISEGDGTVAFFCTANVEGQEATFQAACDEMNGTFEFQESYETFEDGVQIFVEFTAGCRNVTLPS